MLATLFTFAAMASLGLPGLAGFVAEYMVFTSSFRIWTIPTAVAVFTMILTAAYLLWMIKRVFFGHSIPGGTGYRMPICVNLIPLVALAGLIVFVGIYPAPLIGVITNSVGAIMTNWHTAMAVVR